MRRFGGTTPRDDRGIAMILAVAIAMIAAMMVVVVVSVAIAETRSTGRERQRGVSVSSAESQVDNLLSKINFSPLQDLTAGSLCGTVSPVHVGAGPDSMTITSNVQYYAADGSAITSCSALAAGTVTATSVVITATSTSNSLVGQAPAVRTIQEDARLQVLTDFNKAIYGKSTIIENDSAGQVNGNGGVSNADVYSDGDVTCKGLIDGSVYAQGNVSMTDCTVRGQIVAKGNVTWSSGTNKVAGDITAGNKLVFQNWSGSNQTLGKLVSKNGVTGTCPSGLTCTTSANVPAPPTATFPQIGGTAALWQAGGFQVKTAADVGITDCGGTGDTAHTLSNWLANSVPNLTVDTALILPSTCTQAKLWLQGNPSTVKMNHNLAIISPNGFAMTNRGSPYTFQRGATAPATVNLYLVQPYPTSGNPDCTKTGIDLNNGLTNGPGVVTLLYTPSNLVGANIPNFFGQMFTACTFSSTNQVQLTFTPIPMVAVTNNSAMSYKAAIIGKRETH